MNFLSVENSSNTVGINIERNDRGHVRVNVNKLLGVGCQSLWFGCISDGTLHHSQTRLGTQIVEISVGMGSFSLRIWDTVFGFRRPLSRPVSEIHVEATSASDVKLAKFDVAILGGWLAHLNA